MSLLKDSILLGPIRIFLLFAAVLFVHQIVTRQPMKNYNLDFFVKKLTIYGSVILLFIFVLIQLNMYDIFSLLGLFFIVLGFQYLGSKNILNLNKGVKKKKQSFLLNFFKFMERNHGREKLVRKNLSLFYSKRINYILIMALGVSAAVFVSRYMFLSNDLYTLSSLWIKNLEIIKSFNSNTWLYDDINLKGELAYISFYSKIIGISEEMAIHSFGLLENFGLSMVLYWVLTKITKSKFVAPIIATLFFAFFYKYLPININLLLEHSALFLALCFALPAMLLTVMPKTLKTSKKTYFFLLLSVYMALGFISFFVLFILLPIFLVIALFLATKKTIPFIVRSCLAYVVGVVVILGIHGLGCYYGNESFLTFLRTNMILVDSYTYFPQLITSEDNLVSIYAYFGWGTFLLLLPMLRKNSDKWRPALVFVLFFNIFLILEQFNLTWLDIDLYYQSLSALIVVLLGVFIGAIVYYLKISISKNPRIRVLSLGSLYLGLITLAYFTNGFFNYNFQKRDVIKTDILKAYNRLSSDYLPYSYAVVNLNYGQSMSKNEHHFINYNNFISDYIRRDSVYQKVKENKLFLKKNPEYILPQSVFVFVARRAQNSSAFGLETPPKTYAAIEEKLRELQKKGREIHLFYNDNSLKVYEIINQEKSSKLNDLIFKL